MWNEGVSGSGVWTQVCVCVWAMHVHVHACMWVWAMRVRVHACVWVWAVCVRVTNRDSGTSEARDCGKVT